MKNIVITGASSGIGLAIAKAFLNQGHRVFGSVRSQADADKLSTELGSNFVPLIFDVTDNDAVLAAAKIVKDSVGTDGTSRSNREGVSVLVNNAGIAVSGPLQHLDIQALTQQFDINVLGVHRVTQAFLSLLGATRDPSRFSRDVPSVPKGKIINISSVNGFIYTPFVGAYCGSKAALEAMSDVLRRELSAFGVQVVIVQPGPIKTPIWEKARQTVNFYPDTEYANALKSTLYGLEKTEKTAIPAEKVGDLVYKISLKTNPKTRYLITPNQTVIRLISFLPPKWVDFILTFQMKKKMLK
jgi:NAD(P)-dependent dehydrogenase (short-subunit alcohol dehydrogenase family)